MENNDQRKQTGSWTTKIQHKAWLLQPYIATVSKYCKLPPPPTLVRFNVIIAGIWTAQLCILPPDFAVNYLKLPAIALKSKQQDLERFYYFRDLYQGDNIISAVGKFHQSQQKMKELHVAAPARQPVLLPVPDRRANVPVNSSWQQTHPGIKKWQNTQTMEEWQPNSFNSTEAALGENRQRQLGWKPRTRSKAE